MQKTSFLTLCAVLLVSGCAMVSPPPASTAPSSPAGATAAPVEFEPVPAGMVRVVLTRPAGDKAGLVNVFQGGRFHTTLQPGDFAVLNMCVADAGYVITSLESPAQVNDNNLPRLIEMRERLTEGQQRFYRVSLQDAGAVNIQPAVQSSIAWNGLNEQKRVVSRVVYDCGGKPAAPQVAVAPVVAPVAVPAVPAAPVAPVAAAPQAPTPAAPVAQVSTLSIPSDLVFPFASYSLNEAVGGAQILQRLQQFLRESGIVAIDSLVVKGHSDPIGQPHRKELVSGERAKAVAAYLVRELNLPAARVKSQAVSDRELLVANCPAKPVAQRDACNAPNRRVEIVVTGRR